ncbi:MAG: phytoene/squalene synthase family protein [Pirellulales bacterium]|nr:phytoene/squalene synthase family protein [Pirellulales bacterium]
MNAELTDSYAYCQRTARRAAKNFYYAFLLLPRAQRQAMCALYAFLRHTDDLGDSQEPLAARAAALDDWRRQLADALAGRFAHPCLAAMADTLVRCQIPYALMESVIDGVAMDLDLEAGRCSYETFADLVGYCDRVAGDVGIACLHVWGCHDPRAEEPARRAGLALQLTNILRDFDEDRRHGRRYLPREDFERFGLDVETLHVPPIDDRWRDLIRFEVARAERFYDDTTQLVRWLDPRAASVFQTLTGTYRALLAEIRRRNGDVFGPRVRIGAWHKLRIAAGSLAARARAAAGVLPA